MLSKDQFGFRRGYTVDDQLLLTYDKVTHWVDSGSVVDVVLFDFAKAFDVVCHVLLIGKLAHLGVGGCLLQWISDFLLDRSMHVTVSGAESGSRDVKSGVPQGSDLGPLLFLVYVNFLPSSITSNCKIFADDLKIYLRIRHGSVHDTALDLSTCQRDINALVAMADSWGLRLNAGKCVVLRFREGVVDWENVGALRRYTLNNLDLQATDSHRDLGVVIDVSLKFHEHVRSTVNKAAGLSMNMLGATLCRTKEFMMALYLAHVRPILEFASCVWNTGYLGDLKLLEGVQRRWTKQIEGLFNMQYSERLRHLNLYSVKGRLLRADIIKCWKIFHLKSIIKPADIFTLAPRIGNRGHRFKLSYTHCSMECRHRFFSVRVVKCWNSLSDAAVALDSLTAFKQAIHLSLQPELFDYVD